jgi:exopolysaccharide production protein ExoY
MTIHYDAMRTAASKHPPKTVIAQAAVIAVERLDPQAHAVRAARYGSDARNDQHGAYRRWGKRVLDISFVVLSLPFSLVLVGMLALLAATDGANPFYSQNRVGRDGRVYRMWKLRTMVVDADAKLEAYLASNMAARTEWDRDQKLKADPRITPVGRVLRKASMDELPQLWNVLKGEMSLVGPRPMMTDQQALYAGAAYFRLRPGITGPWQVSKRNECTFADRARFDTSYEQHLSLKTDLRLLVATVQVVLRGTGY